MHILSNYQFIIYIQIIIFKLRKRLWDTDIRASDNTGLALNCFEYIFDHNSSDKKVVVTISAEFYL